VDHRAVTLGSIRWVPAPATTRGPPPAPGSSKVHEVEQNSILDQAFA
jgi:hypothetical protein